mmetsp:Transcript_38690/g.89505  ORF Transcript_38690/g.89505 Transcript_38690/m.89505 type:complete len:585 (+) Transcript_38690:39-1793(+)
MPVHCNVCRAHAQEARDAEDVENERNVQAEDVFGSVYFPMFTVPSMIFLGLKQIFAHEDALDAGLLVQFCWQMGYALFVSHQWLSNKHPDPNGTQLKVMQHALQNILSGVSSISSHILTEMFFGQCADHSSRLRRKPLFIWYDYFCVPQKNENAKERRDAINSIPAYVARCAFFVALCPLEKHRDSGQPMTQHTWAERGWCRTERMARELSVDDGMSILVDGATHPTFLPEFYTYLYSPGEGHFTVQADKCEVALVIKHMLRKKLQRYLKEGDIHNYRFLLNQQSIRLRGFDVSPIDDIMPGTAGEDVFDKFMHQNAFKSLHDRDQGGFSPICYAAINGDPRVVSALLARRASPNDSIRKNKLSAHLIKDSSVLALAARFSQNEVIKLLLSARAMVNHHDHEQFTALSQAAVNNAVGVRLLLAASADPCLNNWARSAAVCAGACGSPETVKELLTVTPKQGVQYLLHLSLLGGGFAKNLKPILEFRADVNERFGTRVWRPAMWSLMQIAAWKHKFNHSTFTLLATHHQKATPLMFSILTRQFEATEILLRAGADPQLRNSRGRTAVSLAREVSAPEALVKLLDT